MTKFACPICGDPNAYPMWVDKEPPLGCPDDTIWHRGGEVTITDVTQCKYQMTKARQAAEFRRLVPDAFDGNGIMKEGESVRVLNAYIRAHPKDKL